MIDKSNKAFTLMEIMILVAVLALLVSIAVPNFVNAKRRSEMHFCVNNLSILLAAKKQWTLENNKKQGEVCFFEDIQSYIDKDTSLSSCPSGGRYVINPVGENPRCSIGKEHSL